MAAASTLDRQKKVLIYLLDRRLVHLALRPAFTQTFLIVLSTLRRHLTPQILLPHRVFLYHLCHLSRAVHHPLHCILACSLR